MSELEALGAGRIIFSVLSRFFSINNDPKVDLAAATAVIGEEAELAPPWYDVMTELGSEGSSFNTLLVAPGSVWLLSELLPALVARKGSSAVLVSSVDLKRETAKISRLFPKYNKLIQIE